MVTNIDHHQNDEGLVDQVQEVIVKIRKNDGYSYGHRCNDGHKYHFNCQGMYLKFIIVEADLHNIVQCKRNGCSQSHPGNSKSCVLQEIVIQSNRKNREENHEDDVITVVFGHRYYIPVETCCQIEKYCGA